MPTSKRMEYAPEMVLVNQVPVIIHSTAQHYSTILPSKELIATVATLAIIVAAVVVVVVVVIQIMVFSTVSVCWRRYTATFASASWIFLVLYLLTIPSTIYALSPNRMTTDSLQSNHFLIQQHNNNNNNNYNNRIHNTILSRRSLWNTLAFVVITTPTTRSTAATETKNPTMSIAEAKDRFDAAKQDITYLQDHFDDIIAQGGGDNVRRYLGTVGNTSGMYGIMKVLKRLQEEANDIVTYTESMNEFDYSLRAADTACYSANFVEFSAAKTKPKQFFEDALQETGRMLQSLDVMANELKP